MLTTQRNSQELPMGMDSGNGKKQRSDINVTPLIDVLLVLLIIFMVIQPGTPSGLDTSIPQPPKTTQPENPEAKTIVVQILSNGKNRATYKINEDSFNQTDIEPKLASVFAARAEKMMFVKGDADLEFSLVADVIGYGRQAGADTIGIITPHSSRLP